MRPIRVTTLAVIVLSYTFLNGVRLYSALIQWDTLSRFGANPAYLAGTGLLWLILGLATSILLWRGHPFGRRAALAISVFYFAWYWLDRLFIQASPSPNETFSTFFSVILLALFISTLLTQRSKDFFSKEKT